VAPGARFPKFDPGPEPVEVPVAADQREDAALDVAAFFWDHRRFLLRVTAWAALVAAIVSFLLPVRYRSTASFVPAETSNSGMLASVVAKALGGSGLGGSTLGPLDPSSMLGGKTNSALYIDILGSRTVQDDIINRFDLRKVYRRKYYKDARKDLTRFTDIEEDRKSGVITVYVKDRNAQRAAAIATAYLEEVSRISNLLNTSAAHNERVFIEQRLGEVKRDLDAAYRDMSVFSSKYNAIDIKEQGKAMVGAAATLQGQLIAAQSELRSLEQIYTPQSIRMRSVKARVDELQKQLQKVSGEYVSPGGITEQSSAGEIFPSVRELPELGRQYAEYYRRVKMQETVYELLVQQYEMAKISEAKEVPTTKILDYPDIAEKKYSPSRTWIIVLSTLSALFLGCLWLLGHRRWESLPIEHRRKQFLINVGHDVVEEYRSIRARFRSRNGVSG
jgi:uncharacterized protein involved in exopolysaccharide biosynthesis